LISSFLVLRNKLRHRTHDRELPVTRITHRTSPAWF